MSHPLAAQRIFIWGYSSGVWRTEVRQWDPRGKPR